MSASIIPSLFTCTHLAAILLVISFSAGLNVYATVAMLGILSRVGALALPPSLHSITSTYVIAACLVLFLIEFVADKIPIFDLLWNALQTFVRLPVAAVIAYDATARLPRGEQLLATLAGTLIALAAHGGKMAARAAVTHSPEPISNAALSIGEDVAVILLTWLAAHHPYVSAAIVLMILAVAIVTIRWIIGALRRLFGRPRPALRPRPAQ
jgi:Domain of unknown function (DUF4126)